MKPVIKVVFYTFCIFFALSCANSDSRSDNSVRPSENNPGTVNNGKSIDTGLGKKPPRGKTIDPRLGASECYLNETGDKAILKSQTFEFDFEPFEESCFVTVYDPEYENPPLGSEFYIFKDKKKVYEFDSRYNPNAATCWVEAVSFKDLTNDGLVDIIVMGKCGTKSGEVQGNEVFVNTGTAFYTSVKSNDMLEKFKTIKDIANFVSENRKQFKQ